MRGWGRHRVGAGISLLGLVFGLAAPTGAQPQQPPPASPPFVAGEILVKYKAGTLETQSASLAASAGVQSVRHFAPIDVHRYRIPSGDVASALRSFRADPTVEYAEPNYIYTASRVPNDPRFGELWALENTADTDMDAPEAWDAQTGAPGTLVAIIDTGVDYAHEDLQANMWRNPGESGRGREQNGKDDDGNGFIDDVFGWDFANRDNDPQDDNGHGTHVAGTIAAVGDNGVGVTGVSWKASIMALKFLDSNGSGSAADAIEAIVYAAQSGARILNNSWGGAGLSQALRDAIVFARDSGALFVAAAGNEGADNDTNPSYPASYDVDNVVSVAAYDRSGALATFSNYGRTSVDLAAPGVDILSAAPGNNYRALSGTSMATPQVSGVAALILSQDPALGYRKVATRLVGSVEAGPAFEAATWSGGRLNAAAALAPTPKVAFVTRLEDTPDAVGPYKITASALDETALVEVALHWTIAGSVPRIVPMQSTGDDVWQAEIPGQAIGTQLSYFVEAADDAGNRARSATYQFQIGAPSGAPGCGEVNLSVVNTPRGKFLVGVVNLSLLLGAVFGARKLRAHHAASQAAPTMQHTPHLKH